MAGYRKNLGDLYNNILNGNNHTSKSKLSDMYGEVINEKSSREERWNVQFFDPDDGKMKKIRTSDDFIRKILKPEANIFGASMSYVKAIKKRGIEAGVFDESYADNHDNIKLFLKYLDSSVDRGELQALLAQGLPNEKLQESLINAFNGPRFNFYDLLNKELRAFGISSANFVLNKDLVNIRPASDLTATRGAAGPGEALLAFLFSGSKPDIGDLILGDYIVELKYRGGRIGKNINPKSMGLLKTYFHGLGAPAAVAGSFQEDIEGQIKSKYKTALDFYNDVAGVELDNIDKSYYKNVPIDNIITMGRQAGRGKYGNSGYLQIAQRIGGMHMKNYFKQIANFNTIAVFNIQGDMSGYNKVELSKMNSDEIAKTINDRGAMFNPKLDKEGFQIMLRDDYGGPGEGEELDSNA